MEDNQVKKEKCFITRNVVNDAGEFFLQVFDSSGRLIAVDQKEHNRQIESLNGTLDWVNKERKEREERDSKSIKELNERWQKSNVHFDRYKTLGRELVVETLTALHTMKKIIKQKNNMTQTDKINFEKAERFFEELNSLGGRFKNFHDQ